MEFIATADAPRAIGPYSQAIASNGLLFCAGQIPLDPVTMDIVTGGIAEQTERVLLNVQGVLAAAGLGFDDVVKTTVFLNDIGDFAAMNEVYARYMGAHRPARSTVGVAALPRGARVEIEVIAALRS